jgi:hypothetical protein
MAVYETADPAFTPAEEELLQFVRDGEELDWLGDGDATEDVVLGSNPVLPLACSPHPCSYFGRTRPRRTRSTPLSRSTYVHLRPTVLALAETERKRDCPSRAVATLLRLGEYPLHVGDAVWFDFVVAFIDPWRPGNRGRVARDSPSSVRLSERCSNGLVRLRRRRRPAAVALHLRVQPLTPR